MEAEDGPCLSAMRVLEDHDSSSTTAWHCGGGDVRLHGRWLWGRSILARWRHVRECGRRAVALGGRRVDGELVVAVASSSMFPSSKWRSVAGRRRRSGRFFIGRE